MFDIKACLTLSLYWNLLVLIETSLDLPRKSSGTSVIFGNFRKMSSETCVWLRNHLENTCKISETGRKSSKNRQKRRYFYGIWNYGYGICILVFNFLLYRHECLTGKYTTRKIRTKPHPGLEWRIFHILTSEDIDDFKVSLLKIVLNALVYNIKFISSS